MKEILIRHNLHYLSFIDQLFSSRSWKQYIDCSINIVFVCFWQGLGKGYILKYTHLVIPFKCFQVPPFKVLGKIPTHWQLFWYDISPKTQVSLEITLMISAALKMHSPCNNTLIMISLFFKVLRKFQHIINSVNKR